MRLLNRHGDSQAFLGRDVVIEILGVLGIVGPQTVMLYTRDGKNGALKLVLRTHDSASLVTDLCIDIPCSFLQPDGLGSAARPSIFGARRAMKLSLRFSNSFRADGLMSRAYLATQAPALDQIDFDGFEGDAVLFAQLH